VVRRVVVCHRPAAPPIGTDGYVRRCAIPRVSSFLIIHGLRQLPGRCDEMALVPLLVCRAARCHFVQVPNRSF
jgi:hypothetical protein